MSQNGTSSGIGLNYCPNCACNLKAIALAMTFAANMGKPTGGKKARPSAARAHPPLKQEQKAKILELRAKKMTAAKISEELKIPETQVTYVIYAKPSTKKVTARVPAHVRN